VKPGTHCGVCSKPISEAYPGADVYHIECLTKRIRGTAMSVGDKLAFQNRYGSGWTIYKVTKITPTGRIKCGPYTLNPDLTIRGPGKWGPYRAYEVTPAIQEEVRRAKLIQELQSVKFEKLTTDQLEEIRKVCS
jgi:hypothetical protein